jgi:hypothetical protein
LISNTWFLFDDCSFTKDSVNKQANEASRSSISKYMLIPWERDWSRSTQEWFITSFATSIKENAEEWFWCQTSRIWRQLKSLNSRNWVESCKDPTRPKNPNRGLDLLFFDFYTENTRKHTQTHMNHYIGFSMHKIKTITIINNKRKHLKLRIHRVCSDLISEMIRRNNSNR